MTLAQTRALGGWLLVALGVAALALFVSGLDRAAARPLRASASGAMRIADSSGEAAILTAADLAPGETVRGSVAVGDTGSSPAALSLATLALREGGGGSPLAAALWLTVRDVTGNAEAIVYAGPFAGLEAARVGTLGPGETREYVFEATLPESGAVTDPGLAGAWASADYSWRLSGAVLAPCATGLEGTGDGDRVVGTVGGDRISGGSGADVVYGGARDDCISGGPGRDRLFGNRGEDTIIARDGYPDLVVCGLGAGDVAVVDPSDRVYGCETARETYAPRHARQ